jgi:hypothetical protein
MSCQPILEASEYAVATVRPPRITITTGVFASARFPEARIKFVRRITNAGTGTMDGMAIGGPREIIVRTDQLARAREVVHEQRS